MEHPAYAYISHAKFLSRKNVIYTQGGPEIAGDNSRVRLFLGEVNI